MSGLWFFGYFDQIYKHNMGFSALEPGQFFHNLGQPELTGTWVDCLPTLSVQRTEHPLPATTYDMSINLSGSYVFVPHEFLNSSYIVTGYE